MPVPGIVESWKFFITHVRPGRLFKEEPGVEAPLFFGRKPHSPWHVTANLLRLFCAIVLSPIYILIPDLLITSFGLLLKRLLWEIEWAKTPDAVLLESPGSLFPEEEKARGRKPTGQYAVTGNKPNWLLEVKFRGKTIISQEQVRYEWQKEKKKQDDGHVHSPGGDPVLERIRQFGYSAISYSMASAEQLLIESGGQPEDQPEIKSGGQRKWSLNNRKKIAQAILDEYARARKSDEKEEDIEYIWLDEFCLSDHQVTDVKECNKQRNIEIGQSADIFRRANQVVVFCHVEGCDHTSVYCPWGNRLFTLGEILHTPQVLVMTRIRESLDSHGLTSRITAMRGQHFREDMQTCAAEAKMWHLYNIMQHATHSVAVTWQSAIHSLVVEAIRRDEAGSFHEHRLLGKALNGLLPRRSQLSDLQGINGWADLDWLLELNQGYYNTTLLAAVCRLAEPNIREYRWWGKPIPPREGSERLEALVTSIPVKVSKTEDDPLEPALSIIGPRSIPLSDWLQRDPRGLKNNREMKRLKQWMMVSAFVLAIVGLILLAKSFVATICILWLTATTYNTLELLVGTIFLEKKTWVVIEDHTPAGRDPYRWLRSQDPTINKFSEWGPRQLVPQWDPPRAKGPQTPFTPYPVTLIDLRTGIWTKTVVTSKPNDMLILAVHGSGITCMMLDREDKEKKLTMAAKVGMVSLPPFVLSQSEKSGTVYVGGISAGSKKSKLGPRSRSVARGSRDIEKGNI